MCHFPFSRTIRYIKCSFNLPDVSGRVLEGNNHGYIEAGLPNITGYSSWDFMGTHYNEYVENNGALLKYDSNGPLTLKNRYVWTDGNVTQTSTHNYLSFDASLSNPIYGNSNTVQPKSVLFMFYIKF